LEADAKPEGVLDANAAGIYLAESAIANNVVKLLARNRAETPTTLCLCLFRMDSVAFRAARPKKRCPRNLTLG